MKIGGWKAAKGANLSVENAFEVKAEKINDRWYFFFEKDIPFNMPDDLKISGADFETSKWHEERIEKKIAELMVRHDITKRILDNIFGR